MSAPDTREDAELVRLVLAGDTELYAVLVNRYRTRVSRYVERFTYDVEDARDVTQDVFIKVYGALDSFDPRFKFSTWLFRIAGNAAIDHLRRRRVRTLPLEYPPGENGEARAVDPPETRPNPHEELTRRRLREALSAAIDRLPDDYRELISLRHYGEMPYEEIAGVLGISAKAARTRVERALHRVRPILQVREALI